MPAFLEKRPAAFAGPVNGRFSAARHLYCRRRGSGRLQDPAPPSALAASCPRGRWRRLAARPGASAGWFLPESDGSPNANAIRTLYILIVLIALVDLHRRRGALIYSLVKFRARKGRVAAQIHGNTQLEIGWTVGAAAILSSSPCSRS